MLQSQTAGKMPDIHCQTDVQSDLLKVVVIDGVEAGPNIQTVVTLTDAAQTSQPSTW